MDDALRKLKIADEKNLPSDEQKQASALADKKLKDLYVQKEKKLQKKYDDLEKEAIKLRKEV